VKRNQCGSVTGEDGEVNMQRDLELSATGGENIVNWWTPSRTS